MTTNQPTNVTTDPFAQFDSVATRIHQAFDPLIAQLIARRGALLLELSQLREDYTAKEENRRAAIQEIEQAQKQMQLLSLKVNINFPVHQQANEVYREGLEQLEIPTKPPCPHFQCPTLRTLESLISVFGQVLEWDIPVYSLKKEPVLTAGEYGTGPKQLKAAGIAIDETDKLMYIADRGNTRIQIVSFEGECMQSFGQDKLWQPYGIAISYQHIFVTDRELHSLFQFHKTSLQLMNMTGTEGQTDGQFNFPLGLCTDYSGDVLIADSNNNRVCIYSKYLKFLSTLGVGQLKLPKDVKVTPDCQVAVLDSSPKCIHFYSRNGHLLSSCVSRGEEPGCLLVNPFFFCLDTSGNVIISNFDSHSIKIISQDDQLIHSIGKEGHGRGELFCPFGICVSKSGIIFAVSYNANFSIQCF